MVKMKRRNESALNVKEGHCRYEIHQDLFKNISLSSMQKRARAPKYLEIQPITDICKRGKFSDKGKDFYIKLSEVATSAEGFPSIQSNILVLLPKEQYWLQFLNILKKLYFSFFAISENF